VAQRDPCESTEGTELSRGSTAAWHLATTARSARQGQGLTFLGLLEDRHVGT
jgi:hypothetical protein